MLQDQRSGACFGLARTRFNPMHNLRRTLYEERGQLNIPILLRMSAIPLQVRRKRRAVVARRAPRVIVEGVEQLREASVQDSQQVLLGAHVPAGKADEALASAI